MGSLRRNDEPPATEGILFGYLPLPVLEGQIARVDV